MSKTIRGVKREKTAAYYVERIILFIAGTFTLLVSIPFYITIIGIPLGLTGSTFGIGLIYLSFGRSDVDCAHCLAPQTIKSNAEFYNCNRCKSNNVIVWETVKGRRAAKRKRAEYKRRAIEEQKEAATE